MLKIQKVKDFCYQIKQESLKVVWPNKKEVMVSAWITLFAVVVFSVLCLMVDYVMHSVIQFLLGIGK